MQDENVVKLTHDLAMKLGLKIRKAYVSTQVNNLPLLLYSETFEVFHALNGNCFVFQPGSQGVHMDEKVSIFFSESCSLYLICAFRETVVRQMLKSHLGGFLAFLLSLTVVHPFDLENLTAV